MHCDRGGDAGSGGNRPPSPPGSPGARFFDPATRQWSIYWASSRRPALLLDPPVIGSFSGDVGVFEGDDTFDGRPVRVRYMWRDVTSPTPHWEQAFSADGGETSETNWIAEFTRVGAGS